MLQSGFNAVTSIVISHNQHQLAGLCHCPHYYFRQRASKAEAQNAEAEGPVHHANRSCVSPAASP